MHTFNSGWHFGNMRCIWEKDVFGYNIWFVTYALNRAILYDPRDVGGCPAYGGQKRMQVGKRMLAERSPTLIDRNETTRSKKKFDEGRNAIGRKKGSQMPMDPLLPWVGFLRHSERVTFSLSLKRPEFSSVGG